MKIHDLSATEDKPTKPPYQGWKFQSDPHIAARMEHIPNPEGYTQEEIDEMLEDAFHALAKNEKRRQTILRFIDYMDLHPASTEGDQA